MKSDQRKNPFALEKNLRSISSVHIGKRFRHEMGNLGSLVESISSVGLLHPIVVTSDGRLIAGKRRLEACKELGWREIPTTVVKLHDIQLGETDENVVRKNFLPSEIVAVARVLEPKELEAAKERQREHGKTAPGKKAITGVKFTQVIIRKTRNKMAAHAGVSWLTLKKAMEIVEASEREPKKYGAFVEEMDRTGRVNGVYRKLKVQRQVEAIRKEPKPLPTGPFRTVVIDPPWAYKKRSVDPSHRVALPYPEMSQEEIKALPINDLSGEHSILWLWTTNAFIRDAFDLVDSWGFTHKTILTWAKSKMGTGDWLRGKTEHCLMAIKGKPVVNLTNQTTLLHGEVREHSRKPEEFYKLVENLCPGSRLEIFSVQERKGWQSYGDEKRRFKEE